MNQNERRAAEEAAGAQNLMALFERVQEAVATGQITQAELLDLLATEVSLIYGQGYTAGAEMWRLIQANISPSAQVETTLSAIMGIVSTMRLGETGLTAVRLTIKERLLKLWNVAQAQRDAQEFVAKHAVNGRVISGGSDGQG